MRTSVNRTIADFEEGVGRMDEIFGRADRVFDAADRVFDGVRGTREESDRPVSSDNADRAMDDLASALDELGISADALRIRNARELAVAERDLSTFQRDVLRRERASAAEIMRAGHQDGETLWCMGIQVTPTLRENAVLHARDNHMSLADALIEVCRVQADGMRLQAEMERRRQRMAANPNQRVQEPGVHPVKRLLYTFINARGRVYVSGPIIEAAGLSRDIAAFVDVLASVAKQYGNLDEEPERSALQFSLNFTPRMDTQYAAITVNMMARSTPNWFCGQNLTGAGMSVIMS
jgi:hypothetical protein